MQAAINMELMAHGLSKSNHVMTARDVQAMPNQLQTRTRTSPECTAMPGNTSCRILKR